MEVETVAQRYGALPHDVAAAPVWVFAHARRVAHLDALAEAVNAQAAAAPVPVEDWE